jgi:hypothetical protein
VRRRSRQRDDAFHSVDARQGARQRIGWRSGAEVIREPRWMRPLKFTLVTAQKGFKKILAREEKIG